VTEVVGNLPEDLPFANLKSPSFDIPKVNLPVIAMLCARAEVVCDDEAGAARSAPPLSFYLQSVTDGGAWLRPVVVSSLWGPRATSAPLELSLASDTGDGGR
jgi:hypothetical protein